MGKLAKSNSKLPELRPEDYDLNITGITSVDIVKKANLPKLCNYVKDGDKSDCYKYIQLIILSCCQYYGNEWEDEQIREVSREAYGIAFYLNIGEWKLLEKRIKTGFYGDIYKFSPHIFMSYLKKLLDESIDVSIQDTYLKHDKIKYSEKTQSENEISCREASIREFKKNMLLYNMKKKLDD